MTFPKEALLAMKEILRAEADLQECGQNGTSNSAIQEQLSAALKIAIREFRSLAASLWPEFRTQRASRARRLGRPPVEP